MKRTLACLVVPITLLLLLVTPATAEVTIRVASWGGIHESIIAAAQEEVAKYGITIEYVELGSAGYRDKVIVETLGGVGPDVVAEHPSWINFYEAGILTDLTQFLNSDPDLNFDSFPASIVDTYTYFGGTWILPAVVSPYLLFYNRDHFQEAGVELPTEQWHWGIEVADAMKKLHQARPDGSVTRYGLLLENRLLTSVFSYGGEILSADGTRARIAEQPVVDILSLYQEWYAQNLIPRLANHRPTFASGSGAMHAVMGTFGFVNAANSGLNWGITYVPQGDAGRSIEENTWGFGISSHTRHPEESWLVAKALATVPGALWARNGQLSPVIGQTDNEALEAFRQLYGVSWDEMMIALESVQYIRPSFRHRESAKIQSIANTAFIDIIHNGIAPGVALLSAAGQIEALLQ